MLACSPEQAIDELHRPIVRLGLPTTARAREAGIPEQAPRRKEIRFEGRGKRVLFREPAPPAGDRRWRRPAIA